VAPATLCGLRQQGTSSIFFIDDFRQPAKIVDKRKKSTSAEG
jgi:hypothetical protein